MEPVEITWLVIAAISGLAEVIFPTLITLWFVVGALAAFAVGHFGSPLAVQIVVFLLVSLLCLALLRPLIMKSKKKGQKVDAEASMVGSFATVMQEGGTPSRLARVRLPNNMEWAALSLDGQTLHGGETVVVRGQESVKLIVERVEKA